MSSTRRTHENVQDQSDARDRIIEATILCMADHGATGTTFERIADAAGVSRGLIRHHFGSKRLLLIASFERLADEMRTAFRGEDRGPEADPETTLREAVAREFREPAFSPRRSRAWFGFWQAALWDPALQEVNERVYRDEREWFSELFRAAAAHRGLTIDAETAGRAMVAIADGAWNERLLEPTHFSAREALALCDHYINLALGPRPVDEESAERSGTSRAAADEIVPSSSR